MEGEKALTYTACPSCGNPGSESYCGQCGEKLQADRITLPYILNRWVDLYAGIDSGLPATCWQMLVSPETFIKSYFGGKRIDVYNPIKFALLMGSISIVATLLVTDPKELEIQDSDIFFKEFYGLANQNLGLLINIIYLFQFPIAAVFTWRKNIKKGFTYGEHLFVNALIVGEIFLFQILLNGSKWISGKVGLDINPDTLFALGVAVYFAYVYTSWIHGKIRWIRFLKTVFASGVIYLLSFLLAMAIGFFLLYLYTILVLRNNLI